MILRLLRKRSVSEIHVLFIENKRCSGSAYSDLVSR